MSCQGLGAAELGDLILGYRRELRIPTGELLPEVSDTVHLTRV